MAKNEIIPRDISWLSFNARVLQEAADDTVPLRERIRFLGIFSNNLDEFFRVRVAALQRMVLLGKKANMHLEVSPLSILEKIQDIAIEQQKEFERIWKEIQRELKKEKITLVTDKKLTKAQQKFVLDYFNEEIRSNIVPLMLEDMPVFPVLNDRSIYLACVLSRADKKIPGKFALISVPARRLPRFVILPSRQNEKHIILLEDIIRYCLPNIFSFFGYDSFSAHIIKVTRDAEIDIDNDISTTLIQKLQKGLKNRKKGKPVRFVYDKDINPSLLAYLIKRIGLSQRDNILPGGRIHNYKDFMDFPETVFSRKNPRKKPFLHPLLGNTVRISDVLQKRDVLLNFPYHSFDSVIDLVREAAIDPEVTSIKITCYRLAARSKIINALTNAVRNGKQVTAVLELRARFDEEANLEWKDELEEGGVKVLLGVPNMKVHAKLCLIKKIKNNTIIQYGFVSTGNLNEKTATVYGDHCLLTANKSIMADVSRVFHYLEAPKKRIHILHNCKTLSISPTGMRKNLLQHISREIKAAKAGKPAAITLKLNSLSDEVMIKKLTEAARYGVDINMVIRGIFCMKTENRRFKSIYAISIVDEYLEHARVIIFHNGGKEKTYISSADWMLRNLSHRIEAACPVFDKDIQQELKDILQIQLKDNIKARLLDNELDNQYVNPRNTKKIRSQVETYNYLVRKTKR